MAEKVNILGVEYSVTDYKMASDTIIECAKNKIPCTVSALAVHGLMTAVLDVKFNSIMNHFNLVVPDGQPVKWAINGLYKKQLKDRVYGPTLTLKTLGLAEKNDLPVYFYGSRQGTLDKLKANLLKKFPNLKIAGMAPSKFKIIDSREQNQIADTIIKSGARIVYVGLGCPRQELWTFHFRELLPMPVLAVGAAFDFHAGLSRQAPAWMQNNGLEWLFRLLQEPHRLWKRYIILNPLYVWNIFMQWTKLKKYTPPRELTEVNSDLCPG